MSTPSEYEVYRAKYVVTVWRDGAVYKTQYVETGWFDMREANHPDTARTNVLYAPPAENCCSSDEELRGIRRKKLHQLPAQPQPSE